MNISDLVVNKEPDVPLKVDLSFNVPELYLNRKAEYLDKMNAAKEKLEDIMNVSKVAYERKLT